MNIDNLDFTQNAMEAFYGVVDDPYFRDKDTLLIHDALQAHLRVIPFCDYLKRYIYQKAELQGKADEIPLKVYQEIIRDAFDDNGTPPSFKPTTARVSNLSKNWLTQSTVRRHVVLLLGFGLNMSLQDVNDFLTKALQEQMLNPKDPLEVICWYCYANHYNYNRFEYLWQKFLDLPEDEAAKTELLMSEQTVGVRSRMNRLKDDETLLQYLTLLKHPYNSINQSVSARQTYDRLYAKAQEAAAGLINAAFSEDQEVHIDRLRSSLDRNDQLYDFEKLEHLRTACVPAGNVQPREITPGDIEKVICSAIPMNPQGNLIASRESDLNEQFAGKRFNRQHTSEILVGKAWIERFDLITLHFFTCAVQADAMDNPLRRYSSFIESANRILDNCGMGPLYVANPYECFLLMCMLSEDPLGTYADVLEMSYSQNEV